MSLNKYFNKDSSLDELSVTELEGLVKQFPYASIYKALLAKKMHFEISHSLVLQSSDPTLNHFLNSNIPSFYGPDKSNELESDSVEVPGYIFYGDEQINSSEISEIILTTDDEPIGYIDVIEEKSEKIAVFDEPLITVSSAEVKVKKKKKKNKKFNLDEFAGISDFSKWLLSFKRDDVEAQIKKEKKAAKKRILKEKALKSITKSKSIISEPLAEILASQGHLDDAKKMYEQLLLKYPEKSSYFAAKINNLIKL